MAKRLLWIVPLLLLLCATVAEADSSKQAAGMANSAKNAYEAGDHQRAMDLFLQAWKIDKNQPAYIYSAARAAHIAKKLDLAEQYYREYLAQATADPRVAEKANDYLREIARERLDAKVAEGEDAERNKLFELAIRIYDDVLKSDPSRQSMQLFKGRALLRGGKLDEAEVALREYKSNAPGDAPGLKDADAYLAQIDESRRRAFNPANGLADANVVAGPPPKPLPVNNIVGWSLVGAGGIAGVVGVVQLARAIKARSDLDALVTPRNSLGRIYQVSYDDAAAQSASIASLRTQAAILGSAGLVTAAFGAWWVWRFGETGDEKPTAMAWPRGDGFQVAVTAPW